MGLKQRVLKKNKDPIPTIHDSKTGDKLATYLQSYLVWLNIQNPSFSTNLSVEELTNYFYHEINLPSIIVDYMKENPLTVLSKTYEYIDRYKDKTSLFTISVDIIPLKKGHYKEAQHD